MDVERLLSEFKGGKRSLEDMKEKLRDLPYKDLGFAKVDNHRALRRGVAEVIYGPGKTPAQIATLIRELHPHNSLVLATRVTEPSFRKIRPLVKGIPVVYHAEARLLSVGQGRKEKGKVAVVSAGTSDSSVAEEAAVTAGLLGSPVVRVSDVGVAGVHRLLDKLALLRPAQAVIVVAGMEGALPSVVAGLIEAPVIAVPTSVGYGASFEGLAALLAMLNSCAPGVAVVNIDNGFGAGYLAHEIARRRSGKV